AGCDLFIHYGRSAAAAQQTQADARAQGVQAHLYSADLADVAQVQTIVPAALERFGHLDILINNAAVFPDEDRFTSASAFPSLWDELVAVNLRAPFLLSQAFAAQVLSRDSAQWGTAEGMGKIINILDARVRRPATDHFVYRLTKG